MQETRTQYTVSRDGQYVHVPELCGANVDAQVGPLLASLLATMFRCQSINVWGLISAKDDMLNVPIVVSITASPELHK